MSYCRWSSMNWRCDVYVYEDVMGGWTTHVAVRRRIFGPIPDIPIAAVPGFGGQWVREEKRVVYPTKARAWLAGLLLRAWSFWHNHIHMGSLRLIPSRPIGLPFDGETFGDPTAAECASRLEWLRGLGYKVPGYAIKALKNEAVEHGDAGASNQPINAVVLNEGWRNRFRKSPSS